MTQAVMDAVLEVLTGAGVRAVAQYPGLALERDTPVVCVGVRSETVTPPGFGGDPGKEETDGVLTERYGVKAELTVLLDLYLPPEQAGACQSLFAKVSGALAGLPAGVKLRKLTRGEPVPDQAVGMFRCPCAMECTAYFVGELEPDGGEWLDFVLRGVLKT